MKKVVSLLFFLFVFIGNIAYADIILEGEAEYNVYSAKNALEETVQYRINPKIFKFHLLDVNRLENMTALLKGQAELKDRTLAIFSNGNYGVVYKKDPLHAYYYSNSGVLEYVDVRTGLEYPYKSYQYDMTGSLVNMGLRVSKEETYLYDVKGNLIAHWVGENGYDERGRVVMKRKFME